MENQTCGTLAIGQTDYVGQISITATGKTCMRWDTEDPHSHSNLPHMRPTANLEENYCRNPDGEGGA